MKARRRMSERVAMAPHGSCWGAAMALLAALWVGAAPAAYAPAWPLNDTGLDWCADETNNYLPCPVAAYSWQDAEEGRDATQDNDADGHAGFAFTKLDANGGTLPASASAWSCVRDEVTGLIWEVKTDDGGLRDKDWTYSWYNPDPATNGGFAGYPEHGNNCYDTSRCDTAKFVADVNQVGLCGASDWRLPTREELRTLADYSRYNPAIDTAWFPYTSSNTFWSSSPMAGDTGSAWGMLFYDGDDATSGKNNGSQVRLVRGGQAGSFIFLTLATAGTGTGTVGGGGFYAQGAPVTLTATPDIGSGLAGWDPSPCAASFAMPATDLTCTATFTLNHYSVTASAGLHGTIDPASQNVAHGDTTTFTVTPETGYSASVSGCGGSLSGTTYTTGVITAACTVSASFNLIRYPVTTRAGDHGSISPAVRQVAYGATARFTVTPDTGYGAIVTGCGGSLSGRRYTTGPITAPCTVSASFVPQVAVIATDNVATEKGLTTGTFTFYRGGATTGSLTVSFQVTGTATVGQDYKALGTSITFPAGASQVTKILVPRQDSLVEPAETVILTLLPRAAYALGKPASTKITLQSDD